MVCLLEFLSFSVWLKASLWYQTCFSFPVNLKAMLLTIAPLPSKGEKDKTAPREALFFPSGLTPFLASRGPRTGNRHKCFFPFVFQSIQK